MKVLLGASVVCVFIEFQNLFSIQNQWTRKDNRHTTKFDRIIIKKHWTFK